MAVDEGDGRAGWLMNRMSLHEPIVIFNVESVSFRGSESDGDSHRIVRENCWAWLREGGVCMLLKESDSPVLSPDQHYFSFRFRHCWPPNLGIVLLYGSSMGIALTGLPSVFFVAFGACLEIKLALHRAPRTY